MGGLGSAADYCVGSDEQARSGHRGRQQDEVIVVDGWRGWCTRIHPNGAELQIGPSFSDSSPRVDGLGWPLSGAG